jgi:hypothetical protein
MSKKRKFQLRSSEHQKASPSVKSSVAPLWKFYSTIHQMPLDRFIDCMVDDNLHALIITGNPPEYELNKAWNSIRQDYADKMGDHEYSLYLQLFKEINVIDANINLVHKLVEVLRVAYVKEFADKLNSVLITNYQFDITNLPEYDRLLDLCYNKTGGLKIRLDMLLINFKAIQEKNAGKGNAPTRDYFLSLLVTLSDHAGYMIPDSISVFEFCERIIRAQKKNEMIKTAAHARR